MDEALGSIDGFDPGIESIGSIELEPKGVPFHTGSPGGSLKDPIRELPPKTGDRTPFTEEVGRIHGL